MFDPINKTLPNRYKLLINKIYYDNNIKFK